MASPLGKAPLKTARKCFSVSDMVWNTWHMAHVDHSHVAHVDAQGPNKRTIMIIFFFARFAVLLKLDFLCPWPVAASIRSCAEVTYIRDHFYVENLQLSGISGGSWWKLSIYRLMIANHQIKCIEVRSLTWPPRLLNNSCTRHGHWFVSDPSVALHWFH